ncbi:MAG: hypothetical protein J6Q94_03535 [Clostridia bacterium]|nr:hypothetical protein [Clostridia bacterium]
MKKFTKAIALFLSMLMILAVAPVSVFAEEAVVAPEADAEVEVEAEEDAGAETLNPFSLIGKFFESIGETLRIVVEFLMNMFSGTGNDALDQMMK